jgi:hypothetical protein
VGMSSCLTGPTAQDRQVRVVTLDVRNQFVVFGIQDRVIVMGRRTSDSCSSRPLKHPLGPPTEVGSR